MYSDDDFIDLVIERLDIHELLDILSPEIEDVVDGLRPLILKKRDKVADYLEVL